MTIEKKVTGSFLANTYILSKNGQAVLIDPGLSFGKEAEQIKKKYDVVAILLTHGHLDHIDGIAYFDVPIYLHQDEQAFLFDPTLSLYRLMGLKPSFDESKQTIQTVQDGQILQLLEEKFLVIHTPGHTKGSVCYLNQNNLFSGDTLFCGSIGRTDFPTGDLNAMMKSLEKIMRICPGDTVVYPGHDDKTTLRFEKKNNPFLQNI